MPETEKKRITAKLIFIYLPQAGGAYMLKLEHFNFIFRKGNIHVPVISYYLLGSFPPNFLRVLVFDTSEDPFNLVLS